MKLSQFVPTLLLFALLASADSVEAGFVTYFKDTTHYNSMTVMDDPGSDGLIDHDKELSNFGAGNTGRPGTASSQAAYNSFIAGLGLNADFGIEDFEHKGRTGFDGIDPSGQMGTTVALDLRFDRLAPAMGSLPITAKLNGVGQVAELTDPNENSAGRFPVSIPVGGTQYFDTNFQQLAFTITFDQPIGALGFFGTDLGDFDGQIVLNVTDIFDVTHQLIVPHERSGVSNNVANFLNASLMFFGFISDTPFKKVEFHSHAGPIDRYGFDNLIVSQTVIPEPASLTLFASGLLCAGGVWRFRRKPHAAV